jgi:GT2 family glycosyltransferase
VPAGTLEVIPAGINGGFAAGVNIGLQHIFADPTVERVWILNPDSVVPAGTPAAFARHGPEPFSLLGGRVLYYDKPDVIQSDGGTLSRWTGVTGNFNLFRQSMGTAMPKAEDLAFICGASMVASRAFWELAGPIPEDYFLYYEEVDWALRRGSLPLAVAADAIIYHRAGSSIGSATMERSASSFSIYFKSRSRIKFIRRWFPGAQMTTLLYSLAKMAQLVRRGEGQAAKAIWDGTRGSLPQAPVLDRLSAETVRLVFRRNG